MPNNRDRPVEVILRFPNPPELENDIESVDFDGPGSVVRVSFYPTPRFFRGLSYWGANEAVIEELPLEFHYSGNSEVSSLILKDVRLSRIQPRRLSRDNDDPALIDVYFSYSNIGILVPRPRRSLEEEFFSSASERRST